MQFDCNPQYPFLVYAPSHVAFADKVAKTLRSANHTVIQHCPVQTLNFDLRKLEHEDNWIRWPKTVEVEENIASRLANVMWTEDGLSLKELLKVTKSIFHYVVLAISRCWSSSCDPLQRPIKR